MNLRVFWCCLPITFAVSCVLLCLCGSSKTTQPSISSPCVELHWSHYHNLWHVTVLGAPQYMKSAQDMGPRSTFASFLIRWCNDWDCPNGILESCNVVNIATLSRMRFIGLLSLSIALEPVYHWAVYLRDLNCYVCDRRGDEAGRDTHGCVRGESRYCCIWAFAVFQVFFSLILTDKMSWIGCFIILTRKHFKISLIKINEGKLRGFEVVSTLLPSRK